MKLALVEEVSRFSVKNVSNMIIYNRANLWRKKKGFLCLINFERLLIIFKDDHIQTDQNKNLKLIKTNWNWIWLDNFGYFFCLVNHNEPNIFSSLSQIIFAINRSKSNRTFFTYISLCLYMCMFILFLVISHSMWNFQYNQNWSKI
jgi:hypothetical protein